jgi:hypothetical protein
MKTWEGGCLCGVRHAAYLEAPGRRRFGWLPLADGLPGYRRSRREG